MIICGTGRPVEACRLRRWADPDLTTQVDHPQNERQRSTREDRALIHDTLNLKEVSDWESELNIAVTRRFEQIVERRRWMHMYPEMSDSEFKTSQEIRSWLLEEELEATLVTEDQRGVVCNLEFDDDPESPLIALRADIDALPIQDSKTVPYRSRCDQVMHACGHDVHTSVVYGALVVIKDLHDRGALPWPVRVRGIFQPAEETCRGAREMIQRGVLEGVSTILATHVDPTHSAGEIGWREGVLTASCDELIFEVHGHGGHAARPHQCVDPIAAGVKLVDSLYNLVPRACDAQHPIVCSIAKFSSGDTANVIPDFAEIRGTLRALERDSRQTALLKIQHICDGISRATGTRIEFERGVNSPSVVNDARACLLLRHASEKVVGERNVFELPRPSMGGEDFAYYLESVPGALFRLGCGRHGVAKTGLHTPGFDVDESVIGTGASILARSVIQWADPNSIYR